MVVEKTVCLMSVCPWQDAVWFVCLCGNARCYIVRICEVVFIEKQKLISVFFVFLQIIGECSGRKPFINK